MTRKMMVILAVLAAMMLLPGIAMAGGWAITTVDDSPEEFQVGVTHEIIYTVLQHGRTPVDDSTAIVLRPAKGTSFSAFENVFKGFPTGEPGQYRAHIEVPASGVWIWEVRQGSFGTFDLGSIEVSDAAASPPLEDAALVLAAAAGALLLGLVLGRFQKVSPNSAPASRITSST